MFHASDSLFILGKEKSLADEQGHVTNFLPRMISGGDVGPSDSLTSLTSWVPRVRSYTLGGKTQRCGLFTTITYTSLSLMNTTDKNKVLSPAKI